MKSLSHARFFATPLTRAYQAPPSMGFSRQEYWSGLPFPPTGDLPHPGIQPGSPHGRQTPYPLSHQGSPLKNSVVESVRGFLFDSAAPAIYSQSHVQLFATLWTVACQALPSMGFPRQEYWGELPVPSPEDFPDPGIMSHVSCLKGRLFTTELPGKPHSTV